jgi:cephalosporin hydroxylase
MPPDATGFHAQRQGWAMLKRLHPESIDLSRIDLIRRRELPELTEPPRVEELLLELGLNDEGLSELPPELHTPCGGLRIWQYPTQFSRYLVQLSHLAVRSYLEIGIRHGGSFVATTEYLERFCPLQFSVGVDVIDCPSMPEYCARNGKAHFWRLNSRSAEFATQIETLGSIDLVFIDSHHEEAQCRDELALLEPYAGMIALHDIANVGCPGIRRVWDDLKRSPAYECFEYVEQYTGLGPFMGIGLAVKRARLPATEKR